MREAVVAWIGLLALWGLFEVLIRAVVWAVCRMRLRKMAREFGVTVEWLTRPGHPEEDVFR